MNNLFTFTYNDLNRGTLSSLSFLDILLSLLWIAVVLIFLLQYSRSKNNSIYRLFLPFFSFKLITFLGFNVLYIYYYGGGDSTAFWGLSNALVDLSLTDFPDFITEIFSNSSKEDYINHFSVHGIRYPGWILRESESYFVSKTGWFFSLISGKNFLLTSLYFCLFSFVSHWRLYRLIRTNFITSLNSKAHLLILFIPSVSFWCTGISKDTLVFIGILNVTYYLIKWFVLKERKIGSLIGIVFFSFILIQVRDITFVIVAICFLITWFFTLVNSIEQAFVRGLMRVVLTFFGFALTIAAFYFSNLNTLMDQYLGEAAIIQGDFMANETYTGRSYDLGISDFTITSLLFASPLAIITGVFRPVIWESLSLTLFLNGLESTLLIYLFIKNIVFRFVGFSQLLFNRWILLYSLIFILFFGFITGLTSIIFGVLVRLRAPLLVFLGILIYWNEFKGQKQSEESLEANPSDTAKAIE